MNSCLGSVRGRLSLRRFILFPVLLCAGQTPSSSLSTLLLSFMFKLVCRGLRNAAIREFWEIRMTLELSCESTIVLISVGDSVVRNGSSLELLICRDYRLVY